MGLWTGTRLAERYEYTMAGAVGTAPLRTVRTVRTLITLALDTTTRGGSVAVTDGGRVLALLPGDESRTHGERLPGELALALERAGVARDRLDLLAVATGPGAFTGLRIGLAAIQGLAMTLGTPVAGVSALDALAEQARAREFEADAATPAELILPWMDAQRGDVFATLIDRATGRALESPVAANPSALIESWLPRLAGRTALFIGDAAARDAAIIERAGAGLWCTQLPGPLAPQIAILGQRRAERGEAGPPHALSPIYVRRPDAEIERDRRLGS